MFLIQTIKWVTSHVWACITLKTTTPFQTPTVGPSGPLPSHENRLLCAHGSGTLLCTPISYRTLAPPEPPCPPSCSLRPRNVGVVPKDTGLLAPSLDSFYTGTDTPSLGAPLSSIRVSLGSGPSPVDFSTRHPGRTPPKDSRRIHVSS